MMNFTKGLPPKDAMGLGRLTEKAKEWIKIHKIQYSKMDLESLRVTGTEEEMHFHIKPIPNNDEWEYGEIEIILHCPKKPK